MLLATNRNIVKSNFKNGVGDEWGSAKSATPKVQIGKRGDDVAGFTFDERLNAFRIN